MLNDCSMNYFESMNHIIVLCILTVVFQVGTDIIYTLSFVWDFKQAMMTTAIKDGLTEVWKNF